MIMEQLDLFLSYLCGHFDNQQQWTEMSEEQRKQFPYAEHRNTQINDKLIGLPADFKGRFVLEESYYTLNGRKKSQPHVFLFTENDENQQIVLTSYDTPSHVKPTDLVYSEHLQLDFNELTASHKFNPLVYQYKDGAFWGSNESMFTPALKFILDKKIDKHGMIIKEVMEKNGKRTFGFDEPIIYRRVKKTY